MSTQYIVVLSNASLQRYIFQSNRLKENIGASHLAKYCFEDGLVTAIRQTGCTFDTATWERYQENPLMSESEAPVDTTKDVSVIYVGGGNAALLCDSHDIATQVVKTWSCELLKEAPGLRVIVGYGEVKGSFAEAYRAALADIDRCEEALPFGATLGSLPVVRTCTSTGLPASKLSEEPYERDRWISEVAARKREAAQNAVTSQLKSVLKEGQHFATRPENELGGSEGQSYVAVVHADGNGMGKWLNKVIEAQQNDNEFLHNLRTFSTTVSHQSLHALVATLHCLQNDLLLLENALVVDTSKIFPIRPLVYGGDDLTFVCDGRVGLHLAAYYLQEFAKGKIQVLGESQSVDACAGVAIVPTKFPFAQAYDFAADLCRLAKAHRRKQEEPSGSWLDFQIIQEGVTQSITALRETQYRSLEGPGLLERPYRISGNWDDFIAILREFRSQRWPRSRAKGLLRALTQGPVATKRFVEGAQWREMKLPSVEGIDANAVKVGWTTGDKPHTPYFDPIEALDFYFEKLLPASSADNDNDDEIRE